VIDRQLPVELVRELTSGISAGLGEGLVGLYLYGSSVSGGFEAEVSDIDLLAVTSRDVSELDFTNLDRVHRAFVDRHPAWNDRLEIVYVGRRTLWSFRDGGPLGVISPGETFRLGNGVELWLQNWYLVRDTGVTLYGPAPDAVIPTITWSEFIAGTARYAAEVRGRNLEAANPGARAYAVLTMCRALCTILTHRPCSKQEGAAWARERMPEWSWLIDAAVECWLSRGAIGFADDEIRAAAEELIRLLADEVATTALPGIDR
jgi:Nucleotidyltransferase domain.